MNSIVIFTGPTLSRADGQRLFPEATFLPPVERGDIYCAWRRGARFIGVIDGYFEHRLSMWHKEALWVLAQGCALYGAASMGALRAAELSEHGMVGVGEIFNQFVNGALENDDEVAIVHEPAELGYRPRSEALCNIRATLDAAHTAGAIDASERSELVRLAQEMFYPERSVPSVLVAAERAGTVRVDRLRAWLRAHPVVNQKRLDACAMLERMRIDVLSGTCPSHDVEFEYTDAWHGLRKSLDERLTKSDTPHHTEPTKEVPAASHPHAAKAPLDDQRTWTLALERKVALLVAQRDPAVETPTPTEVQTASEAFRRAKGLETPESTYEWLKNNNLDLAAFSKLMYENVLIERYREQALDEVKRETRNIRPLHSHPSATSLARPHSERRAAPSVATVLPAPASSANEVTSTEQLDGHT